MAIYHQPELLFIVYFLKELLNGNSCRCDLGFACSLSPHASGTIEHNNCFNFVCIYQVLGERGTTFIVFKTMAFLYMDHCYKQ